jgi:hypothetical protein
MLYLILEQTNRYFPHEFFPVLHILLTLKPVHGRRRPTVAGAIVLKILHSIKWQLFVFFFLSTDLNKNRIKFVCLNEAFML